MRLLLAEDEGSLARAIIAILKKNNYEAEAVNNGIDALDYLSSGVYDAAILDIMMPGMDGVTVLQRARERGLKLPILMLTAKSEVSDVVLGLDSGANDYLTKPFAVQELLARIRAMTRSGTQQTTPRLSLGNITLDQISFELSSPFGSFKLASKEYQMMEMLLSNPKALISAERFLEKIWNCERDVSVNVVWVYISYLRKKLAALHATIQIKATRNAGYSLEEIA